MENRVRLHLTIGIKFILSIVLTFTFAAAISYFVIIRILQTSVRSEIQTKVIRRANTIANICVENLDKGNISREHLSHLGRYLDILQKDLSDVGEVAYVSITDRKDNVILHTKEVPQFIQNVLNINFPIKYQKRTIGWIKITYTLEYILKKFFSQGKDIFLVVMSVTMGVLVIVIYLLTYQIVFRRIQEIRTGIKKIIDGNYSIKLKTEPKDEIGELASSFNIMARKIEDSYKELENRINERTQDLVQTRDRLDNIFRNIYETLIVLDKSGEIKDLNNSVSRLLGYSRNELIGKNINLICKDLKVSEAAILQNRKVVHFDSYYMTKQKEQILMVLSISSLKDIADNITGYLITGKDFRDIEKLQNRIIESEKLASIGQLTAGIAHEIRNLLSIINTTVYYLKGKIDFSKDEGLFVNFNHLAETVEREKKLINDLLHFSKPIKSSLLPIPVEPLLNETLELISQKLADKNVSLTKHFGDSLPKIIGDKSQLHEVLLNILLNALDALPQSGGKIEINASLKEKELEEEFPIDSSFFIPVCMEITLSNNGPQIPKDLLTKIFDPFFTTKESSKRTGLGLSICYGIIKAHKGKIYVQSTPDKTSFIIHLPIEKRKFARLQVEYNIIIKTATKTFIAVLKNIGEGGVCIYTSEYLSNGTLTEMTSTKVESEPEVPVKTKVIWCTKNKHQIDYFDIGLQFLESGEAGKNKFLKTLSEKAGNDNG